jgi:thioredoxin-related protein
MRALIGIVFVVLGFSEPGKLLAQEISWRNDLARSQRESRETGKPLLIDFGTEQCFWCKKMDQTTFRDPAIAAKVGQSFIPLKLDANKHLEFTLSMGVKSYPTLIVLSSGGQKLAMREGYSQSAELMPWLQAQGGSSGAEMGQSPYRETQLSAKVVIRSTAPPANFAEPPEESSVEAARLLKQAEADYRDGLLLGAWERCQLIQRRYGQGQEAQQARSLQTSIKSHPQWTGAVERLLNEPLPRAMAR